MWMLGGIGERMLLRVMTIAASSGFCFLKPAQRCKPPCFEKTI
jgi:hypothetical protein